MRPYTFAQVCHWLNHIPANADKMIAGVCVDSRLMQPGQLFFALPGAQVDGHQYLADVASKACAAVVSQNYRGEDFGLELIRLPDVLVGLQTIATRLIESYSCRIVAITGSIGKTTTKEFTAALLQQKYRVTHSPGNSNSQIGTPLAILNHTQGNEEVLILEMGMTHFNQIRKLVQIAPPDIALITTTTLVAGVCNFENLEEVGLSKAEIFTHPKTRLGFLDRQIINFEELCTIGHCSKRSFSLDSPAADYRLHVEKGKLKVSDPLGTAQLDKLLVHGAHNLHNFLAAAAIAREIGMEWEEINARIPHLQLPERRCQRVEKQGIVFINDSYNATLASVKAALTSMPEPHQGGKKIAVLGGMVELGKFSEKCHREVLEAALEKVDLLFCFGSEWQAIRPNNWFMTRKEVVEALRPHLNAGDVVLLKGSNSKQTWKVLEEI